MLVAWAWPAGFAETAQPSAGVVAFMENVVSVGVPLSSVMLNVNEPEAGPVSSGKSEVSVTAPAACSSTRTVSGRVAVSGPLWVRTSIRVSPGAASSGISTFRSTSTGLPGVT